jgi:O-antigen/teichoic acid export membrane protein
MLTLFGLNVLMAMGRHRLYPVVGLVGLVVNVALNLVLIPRASFEGAAVAGVVTDVLVCVLMWVLVARGPVRGLLPWRTLGAMTVVVAAAVAVSQVLRDQVPWPFLMVGTTALVLLAGRLLRLPGTSIGTLRGLRARARQGRGGT